MRKLTVGEIIAGQQFRLSRDSLVRYAGASGDFNAIHYRDDIAMDAGLDGVLAHGMLTMGLAVQPVVDWVGDLRRILNYQVRFTRPVYVGPHEPAIVAVVAQVGLVNSEDRTARIDLTVTSREAAVLGKAQVWVDLT